LDQKTYAHFVEVEGELRDRREADENEVDDTLQSKVKDRGAAEVSFNGGLSGVGSRLAKRPTTATDSVAAPINGRSRVDFADAPPPPKEVPGQETAVQVRSDFRDRTLAS
jgi:hypothetical protein